MSNHQIAVEKLKKAAEVLLDSRGELASDKEEIQKTLGKMLIFLNAYFYHYVYMQALEERKSSFHICVIVQVHFLLNYKLLQHRNFIVALSPLLFT